MNKKHKKPKEKRKLCQNLTNLPIESTITKRSIQVFFFRYFNWEDGAEIMEMKKKKAKKKKF